MLTNVSIVLLLCDEKDIQAIFLWMVVITKNDFDELRNIFAWLVYEMLHENNAQL
jgi:hypothetical protein